MAKRHEALQELSRQHHHGLALALRLQQGNRALLTDGWTHDPLQQRRRVMEFSEEELEAHFLAEEEVLFPAAGQASPELEAMARPLIEDHRTIAALNGEISTAATEELPALLRRFGALLEAHIRQEERKFFPLCERFCAPGVLAEMARGIESALERHRAGRRRALHGAARRIINVSTRVLFEAAADLERYPLWWPGLAPEAAGAGSVRLPLGGMELDLVVSELQESRSIRLAPRSGQGEVRWTITDHRGGRAVDLEVNVTPATGTADASQVQPEGSVSAALEVALEALERRVR